MSDQLGPPELPEDKAPVGAFGDAEAGRRAAEATTGSSVLRGGLWFSVSQLLPQAYALLVSIAVARFLGPTDMGLQSFISFVAVAAITLLSGGMPIALMRYIGELRGRGAADLVHTLVRLGWMLLGGASLIGAVVLWVLASQRPDLRGAWVAAGVATLLQILHRVPSSVLTGLQRWNEASLVGIVTGAASTAAVIVVLAAGGGITSLFVVEAVVAAANLLWTGRLARRALRAVPGGGEAPLPPELRRSIGRFTAIVTAETFLGFVVWRRTEFFFLERFSTPAELAVYSISFAAVSALVVVPSAMAAVLAPAVATLLGAGQAERIRAGFSRSMRMLLTLSLPLTAFVLALGPAVLLLVYGPEYAETGAVLRIMMLSFPLVPLVNLSGALLDGLRRVRVQLVIAAVAAAVNLTLDVLLIPGGAARGAALANAVAQLVASVPLAVYASRVVGGVRLHVWTLARTAGASSAGGLAAWGVLEAAGGPLGQAGALVLAGAAGLAVFAAVAAAIKIVPAEDAAWLGGAVGNRAQPVLRRVIGWWS